LVKEFVSMSDHKRPTGACPDDLREDHGLPRARRHLKELAADAAIESRQDCAHGRILVVT
jgi:hypothetical protein